MTTTIVTPAPSKPSTTPAIPFEPAMTVKVDGKFYCNCQTFAKAIPFGSASCPHTRRAAKSGRLHDLATA
jgi:hypothetical protein